MVASGGRLYRSSQLQKYSTPHGLFRDALYVFRFELAYHHNVHQDMRALNALTTLSVLSVLSSASECREASVSYICKIQVRLIWMTVNMSADC